MVALNARKELIDTFLNDAKYWMLRMMMTTIHNLIKIHNLDICHWKWVWNLLIQKHLRMQKKIETYTWLDMSYFQRMNLATKQKVIRLRHCMMRIYAINKLRISLPIKNDM